MNALISISEFSRLDLQEFSVIFCVGRKESVTEHIPRSLVYFIDEETGEFINKARGMELDEEKAVILYDKGDLRTACKAYWGFRATGHDDVAVLVGGLKACEDFGYELDIGTPAEVPHTEPFLPFNSSVIIPYGDFIKKESYYQQVIYADAINFDIIDVRGNLIDEGRLINGLETTGVAFQKDKATIVHGKFAVIVAAVLKQLGQKSVAVVLDCTEGFVSARSMKRRSSLKTEHFDPGNVPSSRSLPFVEPAMTAKAKEKNQDQSRSICSCEIL